MFLVSLLLLLFIASPVIAQNNDDPVIGSMEYSGSFIMDVDITWDTNAGTVNTGGRHVRQVRGKGSMATDLSINMEPGKIEVAEESVWESSEDKTLRLVTGTQANFDSGISEAAQIYASWLEPNKGEVGALSQSVVVTHDFDYIDTFIKQYESHVSDGLSRRYIDIGSIYTEAHLKDHLTVKGFASIEENLALYDLLEPVEGAPQWWQLF